MNVDFLKPYELSIWEDKLVEEIVNNKSISYYKEYKIAIIASNGIKEPNSAYNIVLRKNKNGEKTLSFAIKSRYYDYQAEKMVDNPFAKYLINERKIKLKYGDEWHDFIIKECSESSEDYEWSYVAEDAFVIELSKNGYNIEFNQELNNNQGSALELALRTLEDTNWDVISIDLKPPTVNEPLYVGYLNQEITVHDMDDDHTLTLPTNTAVLLFYSFIVNKNGHFFQFIINDPSRYDVDDNNNIIATNYRFDKDVVFGEEEQGQAHIYFADDTTNPIITYSPNVYTEYQGYRYIYQQLSTYDPVMERMVKEYSSGDTLIYGYTDSTYTTSNIVTSFVTNGDNFNLYDNGELQGWSKYNGSEELWPDAQLVTNPVIDISKPLVDLNKISQIDGYLKVDFACNHDSYLCNTGFQDNRSFINNVTRGERFMFRYQAGAANIPAHAEDEEPKEVDRGPIHSLNGTELEAVVAFYTREYNNSLKDYVNTIKSNGIIFRFQGEGTEFNNKITDGYLENNKYWVGGVVQEPSTKYLYVSNGIEYFWDTDQSEYVPYRDSTTQETNNKFLKYYYLTATAQQAVTNEVLNDIHTHIGIFISTTNANQWYYLSDIQLTRYYEDANGEPLTIGNIPTATALDTDYFYIAPEIGTSQNKVRTYATLDILAANIGVNPETIKPIYNSGSISFADASEEIFYVQGQNAEALLEQFHVKGYSLEKILSIEAAKSNCFNILQTIAETFECWVSLDVEHNEDGSLTLDTLGKPMKQVFLRGYSGKNNAAGFKYGINLNSITREVDSNEIVTKLIVDPVSSEYTDTGVVTIQNADTNISGESYIFNFDYYFNHGLLDKTACMNDLQQFDIAMSDFNKRIADLDQEQINLEASLTQLEAQRDVYVTLIDEAKEDLTEALERFEKVAGYTYDEYQTKTEEEQSALLVEIDSIADIIGNIYVDLIVINNYSGITTNVETEYTRIKRQLEGIKEHSIVISRFQNPDDSSFHVKVVVDDYIVPFSFTLGEETYETTINDRVLDIETSEVVLSNFTYDTSEEHGYTLLDANDNVVTSVTATRSMVQYIRLVPNTEIDGVIDKVDDVIAEKKLYIKDFYNKYSRFILEGTWSSQDYLSDDLYYLDALQISNTSAHPQVTYTINVTEISGLEEYAGYEFNTGDITYIEDTEFFGWDIKNGFDTPIQEQVIVSEIEWHLDDPSSNTITIQNYKTRFEDLFQRIQATVQTVEYNEATYVKTNKIVNSDGTLNQQMLLSSLNNISGFPQVLTTDGSIVIDGNSIIIRNLTNTADVVRLSSEGVSISDDGGLTWSTAVSGHGINVTNLFAGAINTDKITIGGDSSPSFRWDSNGLSAFRKTTTEEQADDPGQYDFNQFVRFDQYGVYGIKLDNGFVPRDLDDVKNNAHFALTWDGFFIRNNYTNGWVEITSDNDFQVIQKINNEDHSRIKIGALEFDAYGNPTKYGININQTIYNETTGQYEDVPAFTTGSDGNIAITGTINALGGNFSDIVTVGKDRDSENNLPYVTINGLNGSIHSSNYSSVSPEGWKIDSNGDAIFNNISARGAIKTSVFEYSEVQAVGGIFMFRPSAVIKKAYIVEEDIVLEVSQTNMFEVNDWCKIGNYIGNDYTQLENSGLANIYRVSSVEGTEVILEGAAELFGG